MTAKNRAGLIAKLHTSLKKHYKPAPAAPGRPLLEHVLYAALLEDAPADLADEGFAKCEQEFFDWNEVRVTSVTELAEVLSNFPSPPNTAARLKRCLQSVFEAFYNFDIDHLKKENLGKAVAKFEAMNGVSPFVLSYLVQHGLGGHAIPVNTAAMHIMFKTGIVNESEARSGKVPGLERAIPKSKAIEFSSLLHQAALALQADAKDKTVWDVILSVNKDALADAPPTVAKGKTAKRPAESAAPPKSAKADAKSKPSAKAAAKPTAGAKPADSPKPASGKSAAPAKGTSSTKAAAPASKKAPPKSASAKTPAAKPLSKKTAPAPAPPKKDAAKDAKKLPGGSAKPTSGKAAGASKPKSASGTSKPISAAGSKGDTKKSKPAAGASGNQKLTKRKPR